MRVKTGVGYRKPLNDWILSQPDEIDCLELTAEHFYDFPSATLDKLAAMYPLYVHSIGLSLGTPGDLDQNLLNKLQTLCERVKPKWISEHIAFTRTESIDLGHLNPVAPTRKNRNLLVEHARALSQFTHCPLILENITYHLQLAGDMRETDFINAICEGAQCGLLLDLTNLLVNAKNHCFDPVDWLKQIDPSYITQLHIVGFTKTHQYYEDFHSEAIQSELYRLLEVLSQHAQPEAVVIERDRNFPPVQQLGNELMQIKDIFHDTQSNTHSCAATS